MPTNYVQLFERHYTSAKALRRRGPEGRAALQSRRNAQPTWRVDGIGTMRYYLVIMKPLSTNIAYGWCCAEESNGRELFVVL